MHGCFHGCYSDASDGWGPLLYDVIEVATIKGGGLVSDRTIVSPEAYDVWDIYNTRRGDVKKMQLDDEAITLTPDIEEDNCLQNVAFQYADEGMSWNEPSSRKLLEKNQSRLNELDSAGRLIANIKSKESPMKLTKETLKRIIKEELEAVMGEGYKGMLYKPSVIEATSPFR